MDKIYTIQHVGKYIWRATCLPCSNSLEVQITSSVSSSKMEARIKKIFHRKRDDASESSLAQDHDSEAPNSNSALRTSLYDSTAPREPPHTGIHPIKGNHTTSSPNRVSPASAGGLPLSPSRSPHLGNIEVPTTHSSEKNQQRISGEMSQTDAGRLSGKSNERQRKLPEIPVSPNSFGLDLDNEICQFLLVTPEPVINFWRSDDKPDSSKSKSHRKQGCGP